MRDSLAYLIVGIGAGAIYAMLATGIVVAFKGSGVINFAHGAMAMFVAYQYQYLRTRGLFRLPWVDFLPTKKLNIPVLLRLGGADKKMSFWPAFLLAMLTAILLGAMAHFLVFRPLRNAAPLGKVIGALGVMLYLQGVALNNFGSENPNPKPVFPKGKVENIFGLGKPIPKENIWFAGFALLVAGVLWVFFQKSRFGLATRAAAGNEKGAVLLGYSPERLALSNWILAALVAGLAGVLQGSVTGSLNVIRFTSFVVPALGAALIGNLSSIPLAALGGMAIGMVESWAQVWLATQKWWPKFFTPSGTQSALPLIAIVLVLVFRGKKLPVRGTVEEKRLPLSPYPRHVLRWSIIFGGIAILLSTGLPGGFIFHGLNGTWGYALTTSLITSMVMLSYVVLTGYVGQISLAQMSIAGVAAFAMARFMANNSISTLQPFPVRGPGWGWLPSAVMGIIAAVIVGVLVGLPAVRIRGVQLAVVTIAAAVLLQTEFFENQYATDLKAGSNAAVRDPSVFGYKFPAASKSGLIDNPRFTIFCVLVLVALAAAVSNLRRGGTGRRFLAVRANERAAAAAGIEVPRTKLLAFGVASAIAGVAGVMFSFQQGQISSASWVFFASLGILAFAYLGGITSVAGALVGGILASGGLAAVLGNHFNKGFTKYVVIVGGIGMIFTAIRQPVGIAPTFQPLVQYFGRWARTATLKDWLKGATRVIPGCIPGVLIAMYLVWVKATEFRNWHLLLWAIAGLMSRGTAIEILNSRKAKKATALQTAAVMAHAPIAAVATEMVEA
jgi:branched-chain amino acid transport system permease protein